MSYKDKLKETIDWLRGAGLRKEAIELLALLSKDADDADVYAAIRKLRIEKARMIALGKGFRRD
tara:strand:- start:4252 stop:4443 length:192 start_codon:yes stop_codon:yes gene_type:complete